MERIVEKTFILLTLIYFGATLNILFSQQTDVVNPVVYSEVSAQSVAEPETLSFVHKATTKDSIIGTASYYSLEGCVGCREDRLMANGELLRDDVYTVAYNLAPLDTWVAVRNVETDDITYARVTDRHGADNAEYGYRLIDLTVAVKDAISCSDLCKVEVWKL
jgi:rare lipoprotein A (peptidoglycan hydrolase)